MKAKVLLLVCGMVLSVFVGHAVGQELTEFKGRIIGEKCAQRGKIGECYLKWAEPMVFWTEEGDYYTIDHSGKGVVDQLQMDKAFGQEVKAQGRVVEDESIQLVQVTVLNPVGKKEFFKG